jgi:hypothetical protein
LEGLRKGWKMAGEIGWERVCGRFMILEKNQ